MTPLDITVIDNTKSDDDIEDMLEDDDDDVTAPMCHKLLNMRRTCASYLVLPHCSTDGKFSAA